MKRIQWFGIALIASLIFGLVDTAAYTIYSFNAGYYFFAPIDHIIAFHSSGLGLYTLIGMVLSGAAMIGLVFFQR